MKAGGGLGGLAGLQKWLAGVPSAVLEANIPGVRVYSLPQRAACILVKFGEYSLAGMFCGYVGQALANSLMLVKCATLPPFCRGIVLPPSVLVTDKCCNCACRRVFLKCAACWV